MSTTVNTPDAKYSEYEPLWQKCRDAVKGHDAVQSKEEQYLPKLSGQEPDDYQKYLKQALFYNATGRTFKGYKGLIFRKDPDINADTIQEFVDDCTLSGTSLAEFAELAVEEDLQTSRFGILVDYPNVEGAELTQAQAEAQGIRPYLVAYQAEDILAVKTERIGARTVLSQVRLQETVKEPTDDEFKDETVTQIRVLDLEEGIYRQRVFRQGNSDSSEWEEVEELRQYPKMQGAPVTEIPFYVSGGYGYREPHLIDLVNVNLSHYVAYADHRQGVAWTTRPQPWVSGNNDDEIPNDLTLGGGQLWKFPAQETKVGMLEYSGDGLTASENNLKELKEDMANLGARMLMPENTSEETATEFVIKKQGENSALGNVSKLVSEALTQAAKFAARWMGADPEEIEVKLNTDFIPFRATPDDLVKMIGAVQTGRYTLDDYLWWLAESEMVDPTVDNEERKAEMETDPPQGMSLNGA